MRCLICNRLFSLRRGFSHLFCLKKYFSCPKCFAENPLEITVDIIPLTEKWLFVYSLFSSRVNTAAFEGEFALIYGKASAMHAGSIIIPFDKVVLNDELLRDMEYYLMLSGKDIVIVCFFFDL